MRSVSDLATLFAVPGKTDVNRYRGRNRQGGVTVNTLHRLQVLLVGLLCLALLGCSAASDDAGPASDTIAEPVEPTSAAERAGATTASTTSVEPLLRVQLDPGDHRLELDQGRRTRSYVVHVPQRTLAPAPVMIALHGGGSTGAGFQQQNGLDDVADREGFITVYPEGTGVLPNRLHTWNSGDNCCGFAFDRGIDDVGFLRAVINAVGTRFDIDTGRVYMTGHSNGAMMAYRFAAEEAELVTAIVPVGGALDFAEAAPTVPVAVLHIHSLDDPRAIYVGGEGPAFPGTQRRVHHEAVLPGLNIWARANGCNPQSDHSETITGTGDNTGHSFDRFVWQACPASGVVEHLVLTGSGHGWPGVTLAPLIQQHLGPPTSLLNASEEVWAFASRFDR